MKGFKSSTSFCGYTVNKASINQRDDKTVCDFVIGVGGWKSRGISGVYIKCHVWGKSARKVAKAVIDGGLATEVTGRLTQAGRLVNGLVYINNDLVLSKLRIQDGLESFTLSEIVIQSEKRREAPNVSN